MYVFYFPYDINVNIPKLALTEYIQTQMNHFFWKCQPNLELWIFYVHHLPLLMRIVKIVKHVTYIEPHVTFWLDPMVVQKVSSPLIDNMDIHMVGIYISGKNIVCD